VFDNIDFWIMEFNLENNIFKYTIASNFTSAIIKNILLFKNLYMQITFFHKNLTKDEENKFFDYVEEKREAIESLLTKFKEDAKLLRISVEKYEKHDAYEVEMCLTLPTKSLVSKETSHHITKAIDESKDRLTNQIKKHMALLRKDRSHRTIRKPENIGITKIK